MYVCICKETRDENLSPDIDLSPVLVLSRDLSFRLCFHVRIPRDKRYIYLNLTNNLFLAGGGVEQQPGGGAGPEPRLRQQTLQDGLAAARLGPRAQTVILTMLGDNFAKQPGSENVLLWLATPSSTLESN